MRADREFPVIWEVAKGSFKNKLILVPAALLLSAFLPQLITPLLILGGLFLCFEGAEKIWHKVAHADQEKANRDALRKALLDPAEDMRKVEAEKIKGAIRTDFILSAEIIVIALGSASDASIAMQAAVISIIALAMTVGVYGLVALIVKLDDIGIALQSGDRDSTLIAIRKFAGGALLAFCPWLMKALSFFGTLAMFLVGGGILVHGIPFLHHLFEAYPSFFINELITGLTLNFLAGLLSGAVCLAAFLIFTSWSASKKQTV